MSTRPRDAVRNPLIRKGFWSADRVGQLGVKKKARETKARSCKGTTGHRRVDGQMNYGNL